MTWSTDDAWQAVLDPTTDVYFGPAYHALHQTSSSTPCCFTLVDGSNQLLVAGMRTTIDGSDAFDLQTCNGYGGPLARGDSKFLAEAWAAWKLAAKRERIVAALFRLHPLLDQRPWLPPDATVRHERETVFVDLTDGLEAAWNRADGRHRNMVQRARREGASVQSDPAGWPAFITLYRAAMDRLGAAESLRFSDTYFSRLCAHGSVELLSLSDARGVASAAVMLWGPQWGHYHLAARRHDAPNYAANLVLQVAIERAQQRGLSGIHLGGGTTNASDDSLLRFKRSLGGRAQPFHVARVIADPEAFEALVARRGGSPTWLLGYRQP